LNAKGQIGVGERCIEADRQGIKLVFCPLGSVEGPWHYEEVRFAINLAAICNNLLFFFQSDKTLMHREMKKCIALHPQSNNLSLMPCDPINTYQQWVFKEIPSPWH
jgi:polypeptide N-acetylgalactosaminyltransferase